MDVHPSDLSERLANAQFDLYAFISVLMHGAPEASDVLQETNLAILKSAEHYDSARPFMPWARGVARKRILKHYDARNRDRRLVFDSGMMEQLADKVPCADEAAPHEDLARLRVCMGRLEPRQRALVEARYLRGEMVKAIAVREKRSEVSISVVLHRVRQALAECVAKARKRGEVYG